VVTAPPVTVTGLPAFTFALTTVHSPPAVSGTPFTTVPPPTAHVEVQNWKVYFDGRNDPVAFVERVQELWDAQGIPMNVLLPHMPDLLEGEAALLFRNNRGSWRSWGQFLADFRSFYFPINYAEDLELEISRRRQRPDETAGAYITELQTLIRRHGGISPEEELRWLYRNMLPEYRQQIRRGDFLDRTSFARSVRETELLFKDLHSPPPPIPSSRLFSGPRAYRLY